MVDQPGTKSDVAFRVLAYAGRKAELKISRVKVMARINRHWKRSPERSRYLSSKVVYSYSSEACCACIRPYRLQNTSNVDFRVKR